MARVYERSTSSLSVQLKMKVDDNQKTVTISGFNPDATNEDLYQTAFALFQVHAASAKNPFSATFNAKDMISSFTKN